MNLDQDIHRLDVEFSGEQCIVKCSCGHEDYISASEHKDAIRDHKLDVLLWRHRVQFIEYESEKLSSLSPLAYAEKHELIVSIPCILNKTYHVFQTDIDKYSSVYPAIDCIAEARKAALWIETHPDNKKTLKGMPRFMNGWMSRAQNNAKPKAPVPPSKPERTFLYEGQRLTAEQLKEKGVEIVRGE